ncbi:intermembrane space import and assembly protein 40 [Aspergillus bombycis]|uniref:Mitochondrial intermembrane space import and assembly protein 40 n=1 Tax=Aspergillus bombycis TaxID=109264 RepID=A0A1F8AHY4_9EURO|nr:intermembrane space import and assembly protein 40 [Aspergillus bombycis]OGM50918.1 intermembrane space import and assembly protein 40 [Aspergillus bombycis]
MFRPASRALLRAPAVARGPASRRLISTAPAESKSRSWKNTAVRLGLAAGAIYYYNTSNVFAENPSFSLNSQLKKTSAEEPLPTLDSIKPRIREERESAAPKPHAEQAPAQELSLGEGALKSPQELEEEAGQEAAFNPETGEINWDCPCLGGMAHGPCGEEFKAAFSCFVYSEEEPKGMDCIEKFKGMQDCFRQYPEVYGAELEDDEEGAPAPAPEGEAQNAAPLATEVDAASHPEEKHARAKETTAQVKSELSEKGELPESDDLLPKASHDSENKNETQSEK